MNFLSRWLRSRRTGESPRNPTHDSAPTPASTDALDEARALARAGRDHEASRAYARICRKHPTVDVLIEHAELMLAMGDGFGAASNASRALEQAPTHARALAIQSEVLRRDDAERGS